MLYSYYEIFLNSKYIIVIQFENYSIKNRNNQIQEIHK
jgi:hypothetical protein